MEPIFELRKDISIPGRYIKAGEKKTKGEWEKIFPNAFDAIFDWMWFIDTSKQASRDNHNEGIMSNVVDEVFEKMGLRSISYKEACIEAIKDYIKIINKDK